MTKRMGSVYALDCDLTTYGEDGAPVVTPEGTPVKVYMTDGIGLDVSDEEAEACLRASTQKERREYARLDDEHRKGL